MRTSWINNKGGGGGDGEGGRKGLQLISTATQNTLVTKELENQTGKLFNALNWKNTYCLKLDLILRPRKAHLTALQCRCEMLSVD